MTINPTFDSLTVGSIAASGPLTNAYITSNSSVTSRALEARFGESVNVKDYGAAGNGSTDDQAAIAAALAAATSTTKKVAFFPPGTYNLSSNVSVPTGVTLYAQPGTVIIQPAAGNSTNPVLLNIANVSNVRVSGMTFDGAIATIGNNNNVCTTFQASNVVFDSCTFQNTRGIGAIFSTAVSNSGVRNCVFNNVGMYWQTSGLNADQKQGVAFSSGANNKSNFVTGCYFTSIGLDAVSASSQTNFLVGQNRFDTVGGRYSNGGAAIYCPGNTGCVIVGNSVNAAFGNGIDCPSSCADYTINGNTVKASGGCGIVVEGTNVTISSNISNNNWQGATSALKSGIAIGANSASSNVIVVANTCCDTQGSPTQQWGFQIRTGATATGILVDRNNILSGNVLAAFGELAVGYTTPGTTTLYNTGSSVGNGADTTEDTLQTYTVPGGTLINVGDRLHIVAGGNFTSSTDVKVARIRFGGTIILANPTTTATGQSLWFADAWVIKTGSSTQSYMSGAGIVNASVAGTRNGTATETDTSGIIVKVTGQNNTNSVSGSVTCQFFSVDVVR